MENHTENRDWMCVAEVKLSYRNEISPNDRPLVTGSADSHRLFRSIWDEDYIQFFEQFKVLLLNNASRVLGVLNLSSGGTSATVVDTKMVLGAAIKAMATRIVLAHNHPSGTLKPSTADIRITKNVVAGAKIFDIQVLDHIILTHEGYYSFSDNGLLD